LRLESSELGGATIKYYAELTKQQNERYAREAKAARDEYKRQRNAHDKARGWPPTYPDVE
jgi:hypothetical protein